MTHLELIYAYSYFWLQLSGLRSHTILVSCWQIIFLNILGPTLKVIIIIVAVHCISLHKLPEDNGDYGINWSHKTQRLYTTDLVVTQRPVHKISLLFTHTVVVSDSPMGCVLLVSDLDCGLMCTINFTAIAPVGSVNYSNNCERKCKLANTITLMVYM